MCKKPEDTACVVEKGGGKVASSPPPPSPVPSASGFCKNGVLKTPTSNVCCAKSCGDACGKANKCEIASGGAEKCCHSDIRKSGKICADEGDTACKQGKTPKDA